MMGRLDLKYVKQLRTSLGEFGEKKKKKVALID